MTLKNFLCRSQPPPAALVWGYESLVHMMTMAAGNLPFFLDGSLGARNVLVLIMYHCVVV